jgi:hypothetical protein
MAFPETPAHLRLGTMEKGHRSEFFRAREHIVLLKSQPNATEEWWNDKGFSGLRSRAGS